MPSAKQESFNKYPIHRLELQIKKFTKVLSVDLERLKRHAVNISRLTKFEDWPGLHKEQVNASRTVQQINSNILEVEKARKQVIDEDIHDFDERINPLRMQAVEAMKELVAFIGQGHTPMPVSTPCRPVETGVGDIDLNLLLSDDVDSVRVPFPELNLGPSLSEALQQSAAASTIKTSTAVMGPPCRQKEKGSNSHINAHTEWKTSTSQYHHSSVAIDGVGGPTMEPSSIVNSVEAETQPSSLITATLHVAPQNSQASASWQELQESIMDLNSLVNEFATRVEEQGESIDAIEDHIDQAEVNVAEGTSHLAKASKYKSVMLPVVGAVVGGVVGGPIGLLAGMKIGGVAGVIGGAVGFAGGRFIKKRQDKITNIELSNMEVKKSQSLPDVLDSSLEEQVTTPLSQELNNQSVKSKSTGQVNFSNILSYFSSSSSPPEGSKQQ